MRRPSIIVEARLARPRLPRVLKRQRLIRQLKSGLAEHPVVLICAGAGYGKTTLLASLLDHAPVTTLWYSLGEEDAEFAVFLTHLTTALRRENSRYGRATTAFLREGPLPPRAGATAAGAFLNDLSRVRESVVIVLDDFHLVAESPEIIRFLSIVLENNRTPVRFVLATRAEPPLPLGRLRARRQILELGPTELAFTSDEYRLLFSEVYGQAIGESELRQIIEFTAGWVAPLQLVLRGSRGELAGRLDDALAESRRSHSHLHDYLAAEIVDRESLEVRRFLLLTARLHELDAGMLQSILPDLDVEALLHRLRRRNLVQAFEGAAGSVYRYHALLREFLERLAVGELEPGATDNFHVAVARLFQARGDLASAARHLALCRDSTGLAGLLETAALTLLNGGHYLSLCGWLESLPAALRTARPQLGLRLGDARYFLGQWPAAEIEYRAALEAFRTVDDVIGEAWATLGLARIWNLTGQAEDAARECRSVVERLATRPAPAPADTELAIRLRQALSAAHFYLGRYGEALTALDQIESLAAGNSDRLAAIWNNRAVIHASRGDYPAAARAFEKGLRFPGARVSPRAPLHLTNLALLLNELGDAERARPLFDEALNAARRSENRSQILTALLGQAHLAQRLGDSTHCLELIQEVERLNEGPNLPLIRADAQALRARLLTEAGQYAPARAAIEGAIETHGATAGDANALLYRAQAAAIDLAAGATEAAHAELTVLQEDSRSLEALFPRAQILFYLGEAARRLERPEAIPRLVEALSLGRRLGYDSFFLAEWRRNAAPFEDLLRAGEATADLRRLCSRAGQALEGLVLPLVGAPELPEASALTLLQALEESGGPESYRRLAASGWVEAPALRKRVRRCLDALEERYPELQAEPCAVAGLYLQTLGAVALRGPAGDLPLGAWKSQRALSIFIYLALHGGRGAAKERLMELFWPGGQSRRAEQNFHPTISYARRALRDVTGGPVFVVKNGIYQLDSELNLAVDARLFEARLAEARAEVDRTAKLRHLEGALALYQGDFLESRYEAWTEEIRTHLARRYDEALSDAGALYFRNGQVEKALFYYRIAAGRNPLSEEPHVRIMECAHRLGDRQSIRDCHEALRSRLQSELGVEPLPETTRRYLELTRSVEGMTDR